MCFFDQTVWTCGYWRWGEFRQGCCQTGEVCGLKLIYESNHVGIGCGLCKRAITKQRKVRKMGAGISQWPDEEARPTIVKKATQQMTQLQQEVFSLMQQHEIKVTLGRRVAQRNLNTELLTVHMGGTGYTRM